MALGDRITVLVDQGERAPVKHELAVGSSGGKVGWKREDGFVTIAEESRSGGLVRASAFAEGRVISVIEEPRR